METNETGEISTFDYDDLMVECVNDRCYEGCSAPCPYCELIEPFRKNNGQFTKMS